MLINLELAKWDRTEKRLLRFGLDNVVLGYF